MNILIARKGKGFLPADQEADELHRKLGDGELIALKVLKIRNLAWHRMYFGICRNIGLNQDPPRDESSIDHELRIRAGHYDVMHLHDVEGVEIRMPKRIAFDRMTGDEWEALWPSLELAIREHFGDEYIGERAA
jgi:hypothetical protein